MVLEKLSEEEKFRNTFVYKLRLSKSYIQDTWFVNFWMRTFELLNHRAVEGPSRSVQSKPRDFKLAGGLRALLERPQAF